MRHGSWRTVSFCKIVGVVLEGSAMALGGMLAIVMIRAVTPLSEVSVAEPVGSAMAL